MTASTTQLTTRCRTWPLVAGLTGLLIAFGALIGGPLLWLFAAFAVAINLGSYLYSDRLALRVARAQPLTEHQAPELFEIARDLAQRASLPPPRLYILPSGQANAFATGRDPQHSAVAMTNGLLCDIELVQVPGVLAHEFAHIKNHDILVSSIAAMVTGTISALLTMLPLSFLFGGRDDEILVGTLAALATLILAPTGALLLQMGVSRQREYLADSTAAQLLGSGTPLANALEAIGASRTTGLQDNFAAVPMYIVNPVFGPWLASLISTHPPFRSESEGYAS